MNAGKLRLTFNMSDPEEKDEGKLALQATDMWLVMHDFQSHLRNKLKYEELSEEEHATLDKLRDVWYSIKKEHGVE